MTLKQDPIIEEVVAEDGNSATLTYTCLWSERGTVQGLPLLGDAYSGGGQLLVVRRKAFKKIPAKLPADDMCQVAVEYSTPRPEIAAGDGPLPAPPWEEPPTIDERVTTDHEAITVLGAYKVTATEELLTHETEMLVPHQVYTRVMAHEQDHSTEMLDYLLTVNNAAVQALGDMITFAGSTGQLLLDGYEVRTEYRRVGDESQLVYITTMVFKKRLIHWNKVWRNAEPWRTALGAVLTYNDAKPFRPNGPHKFGDVVLKPAMLNDTGDYKLNLNAIGWQTVANVTIDPLTGQTYVNTGKYKEVDWSDIIPCDPGP